MELLHHGCHLNVMICTKQCAFSCKRRSRCGEKLAPMHTVADIAALKSNLSRTALALELKLPADFFLSLLTLCFASLHVLRCFVHWNCCMTASCFQVMCCDSDCVLQLGLCGSQWNGCVNASGCCGCVQNTIAFCG